MSDSIRMLTMAIVIHIPGVIDTKKKVGIKTDKTAQVINRFP